MPLTSPEIDTGDAVAVESTHAPVPIWYWYFVTGEPPLLANVNASEAERSPSVGTIEVGADGTVRGVNVTSPDGALWNIAFTAAMRIL